MPLIYILYIYKGKQTMTMETYSSNKNNSLFQDLGPFKVLSADTSYRGKSLHTYKNTGSQFDYGSSQEHGIKEVIGESFSITNVEKQGDDTQPSPSI